MSGKTDYLVAGTVLEDGRPVTESSKYRTAVEKKVTFNKSIQLLLLLLFMLLYVLLDAIFYVYCVVVGSHFVRGGIL